MRLLIQRVKKAAVYVDGKIVGGIGLGACVYFSSQKGDQLSQVFPLSQKLLHFRFLEDENHKMNRSLLEKNEEILVVSQFTLYADTHEGRRPSFTKVMEFEEANKLYDAFIQELKKTSLKNVQSGIFGKEMQIEMVCDGPITLLVNFD